MCRLYRVVIMASPDPEITFRDLPDFDSDDDSEGDDSATSEADSVASVHTASSRLGEDPLRTEELRESVESEVDEEAAGGQETVIANVHTEEGISSGEIRRGRPAPFCQAEKKQTREVNVLPSTSRVTAVGMGRGAGRPPGLESDRDRRIWTVDSYRHASRSNYSDRADKSRREVVTCGRGADRKETDSKSRRVGGRGSHGGCRSPHITKATG